MRMYTRIGLGILSGLLISLSMPNYNQWYLAWIAFIPLLIAMEGENLDFNKRQWIIFPGTLIWSIAVHNWYPSVMGPFLGFFLILAVAVFFAATLALGKSLELRLKSPLKVLVIPITWTFIEWLRFKAPVTSEWWFVLLGKSQWNFEPALSALSIGGFALLSFLIILTNTILVISYFKWRETKQISFKYCSFILLPIFILSVGQLQGNHSSERVVKIAAISDMITQNKEITSLAKSDKAGDGYVADSEEMMQAIFDVNAEMTKEVVAKEQPKFVVWSENEFTNANNDKILDQAKELAKSLDIYLIVDVVWDSPSGMHDTALMIGPDGKEVGRRAKIQMTDGELEYGFVPGEETYSVFETKYGNVGLVVCWDKHRNDIIRNLVKNGAEIILIPDDNDFEGNKRFPLFASTDSVFRAAENGVAMSSASVSGNSMVINPNGKIIDMTKVNQKEVAVGEVYINDTRTTLFNKFGDWFAWMTTIFFFAIVIKVITVERQRKGKQKEIVENSLDI